MSIYRGGGAGAYNEATCLILASASPRRSALLKQIGAAFEIRPANADETLNSEADPGDYVTEIARRKAAAVAAQIKSGAVAARAISGAVAAQIKSGAIAGENYNRIIVIGADTIVVTRDGEILGKPADDEDAIRMLQVLSGRWHVVYTGIALIDLERTSDDMPKAFHANRSLTGFESTRVKMCTLGDDEIDYYVKSGEPRGKAGAYAIQGAGALFIESVEGCFFNVVGLPLRLLSDMLGKLGYSLLKNNKRIL